MKIIVTDNNTQKIIIYTLDEEKDMCDLIEDRNITNHQK